MNRVDLENKIKKIVNFTGKTKLIMALEKSISSFEFHELEKILEFLQSGNNELLVNFLMSKMKELNMQVSSVKRAKGQIFLGKNRRIEKAERIEEEKELENLLKQL